MIRRIFTVLLLALFAVASQAQTLTGPQLATACTACKAAAACNTPRLAGDTGQVMAWINGAGSPVTLAWYTAAPQAAVRQAPTYTTYDSLTQGKRDSWVLFLGDSQDFTRARIRNWVVDVWGAATAASNAEAVLLAGTFSATNLQNALGGTSRTTGTVAALDLTYPFQAPSSTADWLVVAANCQ
jgi:hypothetical protein